MILAFALVALFALCLYGWGRAVRRVLNLERGIWPATLVLGMAAVLFLGGWLNLLRLARPAALAGVVGIGILLALPSLKRVRMEIQARQVIVFALAMVILGFTAHTLLPPSAYNYHDDYGKYFGHAVRMIETGTVFSSQLSGTGSQTLGGQTFMQAFVVAFFPIRYIGGLDSVFGLFLCLMLAAEFTPEKGEFAAMTALCVLSVIVINAQSVNITAVYTGAAVLLAAAALSTDPREAPHPVAMGLLYAAMVALKPTFVLFAALHLLFFSTTAGFRWAFRAGMCFVAFLSPWLLLELPNYWTAIHASGAPEALTAPADPDQFSLFSFETSDYGSSTVDYTLIVGSIALSSLLAAWALRKQNPSSIVPRRIVATCFAGVVPYFIQQFDAPLQFGYKQAARYAAPFLIAFAPAAFGWAATYLRAWKRLNWLPPVIALLSLLPFLPSLQDRVRQAANYGSVLGFSWLAQDPEYMDYNRKVLYGSARAHVAALQNMVPAGEPLIAWLTTPFYLNFARNPVIEIESHGLTTGRPMLPQARYLIWQYDGYAMLGEDDFEDESKFAGALDRRIGVRSLEVLHRVETLAQQGQVLFDDGETKVVRIF